MSPGPRGPDPDVPRLLLLTDRHVAAAAGHDLVDVVVSATAAGVPGVVGREKDLPRPDRERLLRRLRDHAHRAGARLLVASDVALAADLAADGLHLAADDAWPEPPRGLVGRSCHTVAEVEAAAAEGADYVTVSPVAPTPTKPGYGPPLRERGLVEAVVAAGGMPVLALGGVTAADVPRWRATGAHGVAVLGAVCAAPDPAAAAAELLDQLEAT